MKRPRSRSDAIEFNWTHEDSIAPGAIYPLHMHDSWELLLVTQGVMGARTLKKDGKKEGQGVVGSIFIRPPGVVHEEWCISKVSVKVKMLFWSLPSTSKIKPPAEAFDSAGRVANGLLLIKDLQERLPRPHHMLDNMAEIVLFECLESIKPIVTNRFSKVLDYIHQNLAEPFTVGKLAKIACLSRSQFSLQFCRQMGFSPMAYIRKARLDHACKALIQTDTVLREIARETGFRDEFEFSRVFRRIMGVSPGSIRTRVTHLTAQPSTLELKKISQKFAR